MGSERERGGRGRRFERRIALLAIATGIPGTLLAVTLLWTGDYSMKVRWTLAIMVILFWLISAAALREQIVRPLQTLSNMLGALREEDFSMRARGARDDDVLGLAFLEVNALGDTLRSQRLRAIEASALLRTVMAEIDVAIFAFDEAGGLRLVNRRGAELLGQPIERLLGQSAEEVGLSACLVGDAWRTVETPFPGVVGRWQLRRIVFRQDGRPHQLVVLSDLSQALREEERQAWQRLVRVLGHEINNSLAPIKSIAGSLRALHERHGNNEEWHLDARSGLAVIENRAESLSRFMAAYALLARLPKPRKGPLPVGDWLNRIARLEQRIAVEVQPGDATVIQADADQLDQLMINLVRNAADAALDTGGGVRVGWRRNGTHLEIRVEDEGPGLPESANLFVPFFTTKPNGSGIGLALSRQIAEAHGGTLVLEGREGGGAVARVRLPLGGTAGASLTAGSGVRRAG